jgi:magnesium-transporting ATPase (P-type)
MELTLDEAPNTVDGSKNKNESKAMGSFTYDPGFDYENSDLPTIFQKLDLRNSYKNHLASGLSMSQVSERLRICGPNALLSKPKKTWIQLFLDQFDDTLVRILLLIAMISLLSSSVYQIHSLSLSNQESLKWETVFHNLLEPLVILLILILNASVGVWQTIRATKSLEALEKMQPRLATVLRANQHLTEDWDTELHDSHWIVGIEASSLVPGDVIRIKAGDQVPADARICTILSSSISVDESSLTGESLPVYKCSEEEKEDLSSTNQKMAFSGSMVTTGSAIAIVVKTGANTEIGKIHESVSSLSDEVNKTPLGEKLDELGQKLSKIIGIICLLVWVISIPHFSDPMFHSTMEASIYYAKIAVALGVAAIPEGKVKLIAIARAQLRFQDD